MDKFFEKEKLNELELQGLIQAFEYTHELAWKTLKDFLESRGNQEIYGSKDATRESFRLGLIQNGDLWMDMIASRNQTSHTYNQETTDAITGSIINKYYAQFQELEQSLLELAIEENS